MPSRHTILVVDDEPDVVKSVQDLLRLDYRVLGTTSAKDAMKILETEDVQIVMTDQRMPGMTGVELLSTIRGEHPDAIRLLFTGYADIRAVIDAINQGNVYRYITKPWDPDELQSIINEACDRYELIIERQRLVRELQRKNDELSKANLKLAESNELKEAFISVASHELRTPLSILLGFSALAAKAQNIPEPQRDYVKRIDKAAQRLKHLINQLVNMLAAQRFDLVLDRQSIELSALVNQGIDDVRPFIELRKQHLVVDTKTDGVIHVDVAKMRDCLNHLLLNAIKFTPDDGTITVAASRPPQGSATIVVTDTGVGISDTNKSHLFEPFFTGFDVSHHSSGQYEFGRQGLGLGLSVVKSFVELHGGSIAVESHPGKGSTFTLTLPPSA
jgi:signal transduction histidine kinase